MNKQQKILTAIFSVAIILACIVLAVFIRKQKQAAQMQESSVGNNQMNNQEKDPAIRGQLQALDEIKKQQDQNLGVTQPQTDDEKQAVVQQQAQQMDAIQKNVKTKPLTQKEIDSQAQQLDALR